MKDCFDSATFNADLESPGFNLQYSPQQSKDCVRYCNGKKYSKLLRTTKLCFCGDTEVDTSSDSVCPITLCDTVNAVCESEDYVVVNNSLAVREVNITTQNDIVTNQATVISSTLNQGHPGRGAGGMSE